VIAALVVLGLVLVLVLATLLSYNRFVRQRQLVDNSWSNVDTELRRRYDLIPNLVETVKGYAAHERGTFEAVTRARSQAMTSEGNAAAQSADENVLVGALRSLLAVSEAYPQLLANERFAELQEELVITENRIQAARRIFNGNVRDYNTRVQSVPSNVVAKLCGFQARTYFEIDAAVREAGAPDVRVGHPAPAPSSH
jgi:LemA protein